MCYYLKEGQTFEEVVRQDAEVLRKAGVTHRQVGNALEKVLKSYNWHKEGRRFDFQRVNDTLSVSGVQYRGIEVCPYDNSLIASRDFYVAGLPNGNKEGNQHHEKTLVSEMIPDLIRKLHFFEGDVPYGIKPEWAVQVFEIVEKEGANIWIPKKETVYGTESSTWDVSEDFCGSHEFIKKPERTIELAPGATLYLRGERGVIVAEREFEVTSDMKIDGIPIDSFSGNIRQGQTFIDKHDKIVG